MTPDGIDRALAGLSVSRETIERLNALMDMLAKWNAAINLVSRSTIDQAWSRHIIDSAQVFEFGRSAATWADLGSGGGFPGLVVAVLAAEKAPAMQVTLVESDQRKATFLRQAAQTLHLTTRIVADRIESLPPLNADVVSARALASLSVLCGFAKQHLTQRGTAIFLKGRSADAEIIQARQKWNFALESHTSITDPSAFVLVLKGLSHV